MKFPRSASGGPDAHTSALERLDEAREEQSRLSARRDAAADGPQDEHAAAELSAAGAEVAAREAWAEWASRES